MKKYQHTLKDSVNVAGIGLHSGRRVAITIHPAPVDNGIQFIRTDIAGKPIIAASCHKVRDTRLATTIGEEDATISTVEHVLAAMSGYGIDNASIEIDGPEVPIMDGSAGPFLRVLEKKAEKVRQNVKRNYIRIKKEVRYRDGDRLIVAKPCNSLKLTCEIDFPHRIISRQKMTVRVEEGTFAREIAKARTFGFLEDIEKLRQNGLALGGSLENAVVVSRLGVVNEDGLRFDDEFVRHKILDLLGDLALLGYPLLGHVTAKKCGHGQHVAFMRTLCAAEDAWELVSVDEHSKNLHKVSHIPACLGPYILPTPAMTAKTVAI